MSNETPAGESTAANPFELTAGEQAAMAADQATPAAGGAEQAAEVDAAAAAAAEQPPAAAPSTAPASLLVPQYTAESRDYKAELDAVAQKLTDLRARYKGEENDMDDEAYDQAREALMDQRQEIRIAQQSAVLTQQLNQQNADQAWAYVQRQFLSDPGNQLIALNPLMFSAWEQGMQLAANEAAAAGRTMTDWDMMMSGRQKLVEAGMLGATAAPAAAAPATPPAKPDRTPPIKDLPATLTGTPSGADPGASSTVDSMATSEIEDLETKLAGMSEADRDRLLSQTPGSVVFE